MKIWIDFINAPQVSFFERLVPRLKKEGYEFVFTCRDSSNTVDLLKLKGWDSIIVTGYTGKNKLLKHILFPLRLIRLIKFIKKQEIDIAIGQSSFYLPVVSRFLGISSIYTNDNEHARGNWLGFIFASVVFLPEGLRSYMKKKSWFEHKIIYYPGIKEGIYLNKVVVNGSKRVKKRIFYRPEPITAQYYRGPLYKLDDLLIELTEKCEVVILPRGGEQLEHYKESRFNNCQVLDKPIEFDDICEQCDLFIGGGGSMTRELALVGKKVISTYGGELLASDLFLIKKGLLLHIPDLKIDDVMSLVNKEIDDETSNRSREVLELGRKAEDLIYKQICKISSND